MGEFDLFFLPCSLHFFCFVSWRRRDENGWTRRFVSSDFCALSMRLEFATRNTVQHTQDMDDEDQTSELFCCLQTGPMQPARPRSRSFGASIIIRGAKPSTKNAVIPLWRSRLGPPDLATTHIRPSHSLVAALAYRLDFDTFHLCPSPALLCLFFASFFPSSPCVTWP